MGKRIQQVSMRNLDGRVIQLGYVGENIHTEVDIDCAEVLNDYPDADVILRAIMPGESGIYEPEISKDGNIIIWELTQQELDQSGNGRMQLTFTDGTEIIKSPIGQFSINASL